MAYTGLGLSVHPQRHRTAIRGTFVEDALDGIAAGLNATLDSKSGPVAVAAILLAVGVLASGLSTLGATMGVRYRWAYVGHKGKTP
jgi:hypothetical protein